MPGTVYQPTTISDRGTAPAAGGVVTPAATLEIANNGKLWLRVVASGAVQITVTNKTTADGLPGQNLTVSFGGAGTQLIGPFPPGVFNNSSGNIEVAINTPGNITSLEATQLP